VHFGQAAREGAQKVDPGQHMGTSRGVLGFWLVHAQRKPRMLDEAMRDMIAAVRAGELEPVVGGSYPLADARRAHEDMRARKSTGKLVLEP
jgi:NADPH2:quinone reductase